ncbi:MAG: EAL domain-containing protein, partial [Desulfuromonadaceae bacterium]
LLLGFVIAYITNRHIRRIEAKREAHLKRLKQYSDLLDEICLVSKGDLEGNITYANDKFCEVSGYTRAEMLGQPHSIVRHPSVPKTVFKRMWELIQSGKRWRGISRNRTKDGGSYYSDSVIMPLTDENGNIIEYIAARYEITELLEKRDEVKLAFATDNLTSLGSRHKLVQDISAGADGKCLLLFDIVDFGGINHNLGAEAADLLLRHFSNQMMEFFTLEGYTLYRLHSDIFAVLAETDQAEEVSSAVERFSRFLSQHPFFYGEDERLNLTLVSGIACGEQDLLNCADAALQHAKNNKQAVAIYNHRIANQQGRMRAYWINEVQQALLDQRLLPHYQPIVHIPSGKITRYEALMRMQSSQGELVSPGAFLPIMEQTSHYPEMTRAIFRQACMFFRYRNEIFSVNLTVDDLLRRNTVDYIASLAKSYAVTDRLVLELVETENIHNYDVALKALIELKGLGIKIAIDDFGSGFANFSYLSAFPADFVKIDGSLVKKINEDEKTRNLVKLLIDYAHSEGMEVIAEFVSSAEIFDTIRAMECDYAQGYYFGAPIAGEKLDG